MRPIELKKAVVGVADHCGWAVLVTVASDGTLLDRRRVELLEDSLPCLPHHHECQALPLPEAIDLIHRVRASAERHARDRLDTLAGDVTHEIVGISLRQCPPLPDTLAEKLSNYRAQNVADTVMYRQALADAATDRGWRVHWYEAKGVFTEAADALLLSTIDDLLQSTGAALGPPWQRDHRVAMAAAIAATKRQR